MAFVAAPAAPATAPRPAAASAFVAPAGAAAAAAAAPRRARLPVVAPTRVAAAGGGGGFVRMAVAVGAPAPPFTLPTDGGGEVSLADLRGKKVVLYFCTFFCFVFVSWQRALCIPGRLLVGGGTRGARAGGWGGSGIQPDCLWGGGSMACSRC